MSEDYWWCFICEEIFDNSRETNMHILKEHTYIECVEACVMNNDG